MALVIEVTASPGQDFRTHSKSAASRPGMAGFATEMFPARISQAPSFWHVLAQACLVTGHGRCSLSAHLSWERVPTRLCSEVL